MRSSGRVTSPARPTIACAAVALWLGTHRGRPTRLARAPRGRGRRATSTSSGCPTRSLTPTYCRGARGRGGRTRARQQPERGRAGSAWTADRSSRPIITTRDLALAFSPTEKQATDPTSSPVVDLIADARLRVESALAGRRVTERAAGRLAAAADCTEPTIRRSPAVTTTESTRLPQPWQSTSRRRPRRSAGSSPNRSRDRLTGRGESDRETGGNRRRRSTQTRFEPNDARRGGTRDPRPQGRGARALPVRQVPRQRRLDRDRRARAQPPAVDHPDRTTRHRHPHRPDSPPPTAHVPGRITRTARIVHSGCQPAGPWELAFLAALQRLRALPTLH